jgi:hypothetical protein
MFLFPAVFGVLRIITETAAVMFIPVSTVVLLEGFTIVFAAALTGLFLPQKQLRGAHQHVGIFLICVAFVVVGIAIQGHRNRWSFVGCGFILLCTLFKASLHVSNDMIISRVGKVSTLLVVGIDGVYSAFILLIFIVPLASYLQLEKLAGGFYQLQNSVVLLVVVSSCAIMGSIKKISGFVLTSANSGIVTVCCDSLTCGILKLMYYKRAVYDSTVRRLRESALGHHS